MEFRPVGHEGKFLDAAAESRAFVAEDACRGISGNAAREYVRCRRMGQGPQAARESARSLDAPADRPAPLVMPRGQPEPEPEGKPCFLCSGCGVVYEGDPAYADHPRGIVYCQPCNQIATADAMAEDAADADRAGELRRAHPEVPSEPVDDLDFLG